MSLFIFGDLSVSDVERYMRSLETWAGWPALPRDVHDSEELAPGAIVKSAPSAPAKQTGP